METSSAAERVTSRFIAGHTLEREVAVCRRLNVAARAAIFLFVLAVLSVLLYHTVEAPLIAAGVRWSEKFKSRVRASAAAGRSDEVSTQAGSYEVGSL